MEAKTLNCPNCGAASDLQSSQCTHCGSALATVSCPSCFALVFLGAEFCPACGVRLVKQQSENESIIGPCPSCRTTVLVGVQLGGVSAHECFSCHGLWMGDDTFKQICADRERQAILLGDGAIPQSAEISDLRVRYLKCPCCGTLMNRSNFSKCSGVVIDTCRQHGIWFDCNELLRIVRFIRDGGLDVAREREKEQLAEEWRRLRSEKMASAWEDSSAENLPASFSGFALSEIAEWVLGRRS